MIVTQIAHNIPNWTDVKWFAQGGGLLGNKHPAAGRVNGGEKIFVFWIMATVGVAVCVSGVILDFPDLVQTRQALQQANIIHAIAAGIWIFFVIGHIYLGSVGVEGVLEGMWRGDVDTNCAIVGGIVVLGTGSAAIPAQWVEAAETPRTRGGRQPC